MTTSLVAVEGLVLRNLRHGETSRIATLFTRELGKVGVIAKGARVPASPFGASLELFSHGSFVLYYRPGRELQFLRSGALEHEFRGLVRDHDRYRLASALVEFLDSVLTGEEPAGELFDFARRALEVLASASRPALPELFRGLQLRVVSILGYAPRLDRCAACGRDVPPAAPALATNDAPAATEKWLFLPAEGGIACADCLPRFDPGGTGVLLTARALRRVRAMALGSGRLHSAEPSGAPPIARDGLLASPSGDRTAARVPDAEPPPAHSGRIEPAVAEAWVRTLDRLVEEYLRYHLESYRGLRSLAPSGNRRSLYPGFTVDGRRRPC